MGTQLKFLKVLLWREACFSILEAAYLIWMILWKESEDLGSGSFYPPINNVNSDNFYIHSGPQYAHHRPEGLFWICWHLRTSIAQFSTYYFLLFLCYGFLVLALLYGIPLGSSPLLDPEQRFAWGSIQGSHSHEWKRMSCFLLCEKSCWFLFL